MLNRIDKLNYNHCEKKNRTYSLINKLYANIKYSYLMFNNKYVFIKNTLG